MVRKLRGTVQGWLRNAGVEVRKAPSNYNALSVFHLAVEHRMAQHGDALRFVQIGANDGLVNDPLRAYIVGRGWTGILVEPQPAVYERLKSNYAAFADRLIFENVAISSADSVPLYIAPLFEDVATNAPYGSGAASSNPAITARQLNVETKDLQRIEVPGITLDKLLMRHDVAELDLLQIDAEGYDWDVLQTLDIRRVKPALIQFESGHLKRSALNEMAAWLNAANYLIYYGGWQGDTLAVRADTIAGH